MMREAMFYETLDDLKVRCLLCRRMCIIPNNKRGFCGVRINKNGKLYTLNYGNVVTVAIDPIEKKPFYHFFPGYETLSYCLPSCNFKCPFCQNWEIANMNPEDFITYESISPSDLVNLCIKHNCKIISHTYTEPTVFYEYAYDVCRISKGKGILNAFVTNGYMSKEAIREISKYLDAAVIDLKGFNDEIYGKIIPGVSLDDILDSIKTYKKLLSWIEITFLVIPKHGDSLEEFRQMCNWFKENLGKDVPLHILRFFPHYRMSDLPITPDETLINMYKIAKEEGLYYVYLGNFPDEKYNSTYCPSCGSLLIKRSLFYSSIVGLDSNGRCKECGFKISGYFG